MDCIDMRMMGTVYPEYIQQISNTVDTTSLSNQRQDKTYLFLTVLWLLFLELYVVVVGLLVQYVVVVHYVVVVVVGAGVDSQLL